MIKAIFYSKFDTQEGPKVVHQVPDGAIVPSSTASPQQARFFLFSDISFFVIPRQELCGNLLQVCTGGYRILGYPICMKSPQYDRNEFIFNFCFVLAEEEDFSKYKSIVQKLADLMHGLEEQSCFLSRDYSKSGEGKVYSLCETLMEDLNNYSESMIPIDKLNTLNFKLFPVYPAPPYVRAWDVPLFTVRYEAFLDENWDLTLQKIVPYINGVNSVRIISILADVELSLAYRAIRHLIYYGCVFLLDIFSFSAIYAPTSTFHTTIAYDEGMQQECARYVNTRFAPPAARMAPTSSADFRASGDFLHGAALEDIDDNIWPLIGDEDEDEDDDNDDSDHHNNGREIRNGRRMSPSKQAQHRQHQQQQQQQQQKRQQTKRKQHLDGVDIIELYASLRQGQSVKQWYTQHARLLSNVDIRRFITFGIIKGFLYRVHKYAYGPRPEGFKYTSLSTAAHTDVKSVGKSASVSSVKGGGAATATDFSRESSVRDEKGLQGGGGVLSSSYQSTSHSNSNIKPHNISIRLDPSTSPAGTFFEDNDEDDHDYENVSNEGYDYSEKEDDDDHDHDDDREGDEEEHDEGEESGTRRTAQQAIRFHQNYKALEKYLDGQHCFDEICTELEISERELTARLRRIPWSVHIIHR